MNVRDLIDELSRLPPHLPVKVLLSEVIMLPQEGGEPYEVTLSAEDAIEADRVRYEGNHILIESR